MKKKLLIILLLGVISISFTGCLPGISPELNNPPVITPIPHATITLGETFTYTVEATDPEGDDLTYSLTTDPSTNMAINPVSGEITWTPTTTGSEDVDGSESATQSFTITVNKALLVSIEVLPSSITLEIGKSYWSIVMHSIYPSNYYGDLYRG